MLLHRLLVDGLGADSRDIYFERPVPEVCGRIDALLGRTVFELKSDLRRERKDAEKGLTRYLSEREGQTGEKYVGITTDGADFIAFFLKNGSVVEVGAHRTHLEKPPARAPISGRDSLTAWLQGVVAIGDSLPPTPHAIKREFGRESLAARCALDDLSELWSHIGKTPEALLKRELWGRLLGVAYGAEVGDDALFLQHTYLVIVAKAMAWVAMIETPPPDAGSLLHGEAFSERGITGHGEPDFFDWVLADEDGAVLVMRISRHVNRFRFHDVRIDILKSLYESLIDPGAATILANTTPPTGWLPAWSQQPWTTHLNNGSWTRPAVLARSFFIWCGPCSRRPMLRDCRQQRRCGARPGRSPESKFTRSGSYLLVSPICWLSCRPCARNTRET